MSRVSGIDGNASWCQSITCDRCGAKVERSLLKGEGWRFADGALKGWSDFTVETGNFYETRKVMDFCPPCASITTRLLRSSGAEFGSYSEVVMLGAGEAR